VWKAALSLPEFWKRLVTISIAACFSYTRQDGFRLCTRHGLGQTANSIIDVYNLSMKPAAIEKEALHLPIEARAKLAQRLLESLDDLSEQDAERVWLGEAERRAREIDEGKVNLVSSEELERRVQEHLR
jgi:Putative addiction module component